MPRDCATCGQSLFKRDFLTNQWSKGEGTSRCKACVASLPHLLPQPHPRPTAAALSPTQVWQLAKSAHLVEVSHNEASKVTSFERSGRTVSLPSVPIETVPSGCNTWCLPVNATA